MKEKVAQFVAEKVQSGQLLGLGSGSTAELAVRMIGERIAKEGIKVEGIATSHRIGSLAAQSGINLVDIRSGRKPDWAFDGADEVDSDLNLIKGGGACHLMEKIVARLAGGITVIITEAKLVKHLGEAFPLPLEIIPEARFYVQEQLMLLGATEVKLRESKSSYGALVTEQGNHVLDIRLPGLSAKHDSELNSITGVIEHGLFVDLSQEVIVARAGGVEVLQAK